VSITIGHGHRAHKNATNWVREVAAALNKLARPYLTAMVATAFNTICGWGVVTGKLPFKDYIMAIGPINSMIVGFWFGERSALKLPGKDAGA
jgi:hypothetical protein